MKNKPGLWIAALVMAVMIGGICVMSVGRAAENGYASWSLDFAFAKSASLKNTIELSAQEISSLKLEYGSKNIKVYPASGEKIIIKEYLYSNQSKAQATVTYPEKDQAVVTGGKLQTIVFFGFNSEKIEVYVPEKVLSVLSIQTGSGSIKTDFDEILSYNKKGNSAEGNVGAMPEINIRLKANSGNVRVIY